MVSLSAAEEYIEGLVHPSVARDEIVAARHRVFILAHLAGGILAFAAMPLILLARGGAPSPLEIAVFAWLVAPIAAAFYLSRTGNIHRAYLISASSFVGLIFTVALLTGGIHSFALVWLPIVAFEAAFAGSRRIIWAALGFCGAAVTLLVGLDFAGTLPEPNSESWIGMVMLPYVSVLGAALYAGALAVRWERLQNTISEVRHSTEARYQLLADNMTDLVTRHTRNGSVLFASPAAERLLGVAPSELSGRGLFERVHVADRPAFLTALAGAGNGQPQSIEFRVRRANASGFVPRPPDFVWVEMRSRAIAANPEGGQDQIVAVIREVSDRKAKETDLDAARAEAERANAAKGQFLASMSHELRTPLNAIIGFSELLTQTGANQVSDHRRLEYAGLINEAGLHLLSVVNGILDMSRIESGNFMILPEPFALRPVVDSCMHMFELKAANSGITLETDVPEMLPELMADKRACKQILINLLSNAIKFTPEGGRVRVSASLDLNQMRIEVADNGVGVSPTDLPNLGNSFFQARSSYDRPYDGTGLGLSVVKGLITLHGGAFEVKSRVGEGTSVIIRLPLDGVVSASSDGTDFHEPARRAVNG